MQILVTGGAGFIGSHLVERLAGRGDRVTILDNFNDYYSPALKRANAARALEAGDVWLVEGDIRDRALVEELFSGANFDCIVHLAARAGVRASLADPNLYVDVNLGGTVNLLEACRRHAVSRFVFASSSSIYGCSTNVPFTEEAKTDSQASPYGATKKAGELLVGTYHHLYGIRATALRFFTVYGPRQRPDMAIHKFTRAISAGEPVTMYGDGSSARDYTYIDDIIDGVEAAVDSPCEWEVINLGSSTPIPLCDMVEILARALGRPARIKHVEDQPGDVPITFADTTKAERLLGYSPQTDFVEGVRRFVEWYREALADGLLQEDKG